MTQVKLFSDDVMLKHVAGASHPERPERLRTITNVLAGREFEAPHAFEQASVERVHSKLHTDMVLSLAGFNTRIDGDTVACPDTVDAVQAAVGCSLGAVRHALTGEPAFALVRPPGHHAEPDRAMGFCFFNNIAVAAEEARANGANRVFIIDWDVHHGNGTQAAFWESPDVFFASTHQWPLYPGSGAKEEVGEGEGHGTTLNVPMPRGSGDEDFRKVFEEVLAPTVRLFQPDIILVSAGYDAHEDDPLAGLELTTEGFAQVAGIVGELAEDLCDGRLALFLEGGYDVDALAASVAATIEALES